MKFYKRKSPSKQNLSLGSPLTNLHELDMNSFILILNRQGIIKDFKGNVTQGEHVIKVGESYMGYLSPGEHEKYARHMENALRGNVEHFSSKGMQNNIEFEFKITMFPFRDNSQQIDGLYCMLQTIMPVNGGEESNDSEIRNHIYVNSKELSGILDDKGIVKFISPAVKPLLGYEESECIGRSFLDFLESENAESVRKQWNKLMHLPDSSQTLELKILNTYGEIREFQLKVTNYLSDPKLKGFFFNSVDIGEIKKRDERIHYLTNYDYVTGLPNRKVFIEKADIELKIAELLSKKFAIFVLNIRNYKMINRAFGHDFGDRYVDKVAAKLKKQLGDQIEIIGRIGSNEFAILTKFLENENVASRLASEVRSIFDQPLYIDDYELLITTRMGIAMYPAAGTTSGELLRNASAALHSAPKHLKNSYHYYSDTTSGVLRKELILTKDIASAIENEQLEVYFQPIYKAHTNRIASVEALIRWNHPPYGLLTPADFLQLAEDMGEISKIGEWVLESTCRSLAEWHQKNIYIKAAVNVSAMQFYAEDLPTTFFNITQKYNIDPKWIEIEITESALLNEEEIPESLERLDDFGFGIVLDDFGTGYNSLKKLKDMRPRKIKVDRSFVDNVLEDERSKTITTSIIGMAKLLSIEVVAEGVETSEQKDFLLDLECDFFQGYLFSRPITEENVTKLLTREQELLDSKDNVVNRRKYFRVSSDPPFKARMTIDEVNGKKVKVGNVNVLITNIGPGGLYFISTVELPQRQDVVVKFTIELFGEIHFFYANLIHGREEKDLFGYGVSFLADEKTRNAYIQLFHRVEVRLNQPSAYDDLPLLEGTRSSYFENDVNKNRA
ncbi:EAL domain-containing protein [Sporosarcina gallistercoris]|uniref:EAL domain-containing protein n=1 Tax=Sporosarcina gallistercoris TaxID=2762245 RepID=UPI003D2CBB28